MAHTDSYVNPLIERYASQAISYVFSPDFKFSTWRKLWVALATCEQELGLPITTEQIEELKAHISDIDYAAANAYEKKTRHDVMAHVLTYGDVCPLAKPIIHLGATSAYVGDNTDLIQIKEGSKIILQRLRKLIHTLRDFALREQSTATLGFTHFQSAQLVTVGKRATLWMLELCLDAQALLSYTETLPFLGVKGTTGTQASFLSLFNGDHEKVKKLDSLTSHAMGFDTVLPVAGQTYTRKLDAQIAAILSGVAQSLHKMANDIRLLAHLKEIEEPFEKDQIGSSAMAYKRNPMRSERITALSRFVITLSVSPALTAAEQWFERTLDDSANKRLAIPELFLATDAMLIIAENVAHGLVVYPEVIKRHINAELPFMATENILMGAVKNGGDRQELHELIRVHSQEAAMQVKQFGRENDLLDRIASDPAFHMTRADIDAILNISDFVGRAPMQVVEFMKSTVDPLLERLLPFGTATDVALTV